MSFEVLFNMISIQDLKLFHQISCQLTQIQSLREQVSQLEDSVRLRKQEVYHLQEELRQQGVALSRSSEVSF